MKCDGCKEERATLFQDIAITGGGAATTETIDLPSREERARECRHPYWDRSEGLEVSNRLFDYIMLAEVDAAMVALQNLYRDLGRQMKTSAHAAQI
jgi:hypothetical protein